MDYGIIDILTIFMTLINLTLALEISQAVARFFPDAKTDEAKVAYASTALWFTVGVYTLFVIVAYLVSKPFSEWLLESSTRVEIFQIAILSIWGNGLFYLIQNQLRWQLQSLSYAIASFVFTLVSITMSILFVLIFKWGVIGVIYGQLIGSLVGAILAFYFARHSYRFVFDWTRCKEMLQFSIVLVPSSVGVFITLYIDRIAIKELMSITDVGLFGVGYRLASVIGLLMIGIQGALTPLVYTHYREPNTPGEIARIFRYFISLALLLYLVLSLFAREILVIFTTPEYYPAAIVVPLLVPAVLLSGMYVFAPGLNIAKKTGIIAIINIISAVLNTVLNFVFIPIFGIQGAALSTLLSAMVTFAAYLGYGQKFYFVPHLWARLGAAVLSVGIIFLVGSQLDLSWWLGSIIKVALICLAGGVFIWLGLVEVGAIKRIWTHLSHLQPIAKV
jgi:O-antigen/teichoic acid export membrane protein